MIMENNKREYRELSDETKQKISNSSKGRPKSASHRQHISQSMTNYWKTIPNKPKTSATTMADLTGATDHEN